MDWVEVFATSQEYEALLVQGYLEENGIQCVLMNRHDSMYNFGEYQLLVKREDILEAKQLIIRKQDN